MEEKQKKEKGNFWLTVATFIVNKRKAIEILFVLAIIYSVLSVNKVQVNQDITSYLPAESETRRGLSLMDEQFVTYGSAKIMVSNITYPQAETIVDKLEDVDGIKEVAFDDSSDHFTGTEALFDITFDGTEEEQISKDALENAKELLSDYDIYVSSEVGQEERDSEAPGVHLRQAAGDGRGDYGGGGHAARPHERPHPPLQRQDDAASRLPDRLSAAVCRIAYERSRNKHHQRECLG